MTRKDIISNIVNNTRNYILEKYNGNIMGKCIEASDKIVSDLAQYNIKAKAIRVYCLYENFESCSDYCFEEHWLVKLRLNNQDWYIDVTMDQFQWAFYRQLPSIYSSTELPKFYLKKKPDKHILDLCGWNDWYNTGDYENNFVCY